MIKKIEGIVIREKSYRETSKLITVLTKEDGILTFLAKGAKSLKSDLRSCTTKLTSGFFNVYYKEDGLSTLTSVDVITTFKEVQKDIAKISFASYLLELSEQVMKHSSEDIYTLLIDGLIKIEEGYDPFVITNILELKYLEYLGVMPNLDACNICGSKESITTLSSDTGGFVCKNCVTTEKIVSEKALKLIRMYYYVDISKISKLEISEDAKKEINDFLNLYYDKYTGLYLKSKNFLKSLNKISIR